MSVNSKMTAMANSIRALLGLTGTMGLDAMVTHIGTEKTNVDNALSAIVDKGVEVPAGANSGNLAELITSITGGGSSFPNGMAWTPSNRTDRECYAICYGNGTWVVGSDAGAYYSTDGKRWVKGSIKTGYVYVVAYADGLWICDRDGSPYTSTDGINWVLAGGQYGLLGVNDIYKANGLFVAACTSYPCKYSTDGTTWSTCTGLSNCVTVENANGIWVAGGETSGLYYSADGMTWTQSNIASGEFYKLRYANGVWVACENGGRGLYHSTDGKTWLQSNITSGAFWGVDQARGVWVAASDNGIYYSADGMTWTQTNITNVSYTRELHYANGVWVCCAGTVYYSTDGITWLEASGGITDSAHVYAADGIWVVTDYYAGMYYSVTWEPS